MAPMGWTDGPADGRVKPFRDTATYSATLGTWLSVSGITQKVAIGFDEICWIDRCASGINLLNFEHAYTVYRA